MSEEARSLARCSRVRPSKTTPSSMAGSSKNVLQASWGMAAATQDTPKAATAPRLTRESMLGAPRAALRAPDTRMLRPGPSSAAADIAPCTAGLPRKRTSAGTWPAQLLWHRHNAFVSYQDHVSFSDSMHDQPY